jgi:hypothetical protein
MILRSILVGAAALAVVSAFSLRASAADEPLPELHYPSSSVRIPVILGGLGVFGSAYGIGILAEREAQDIPGAKAVYVPIVGPWIALGKNACATSNPDCGALLELRGFLLGLEGVIQIAGTGLIIEGIVMKTESGSSKPKTGLLEYKRGDFSLKPMPLTSKQLTGIGFTGTF